MTTKRHRRRRHRHSQPGARPGSLVIDQTAPRPVIDVVQFDDTDFHCFSDISPEQIPPLRCESVTWINVTGLGNLDVIEQVAARFNIHDLALEDVVNTHQRPKLEIFDDHLYLVLRMPRHNGELDIEQVSIFLGETYVLTWQERHGDCFDPIRERLKAASGLMRQRGNDFFAYSLMDAIVDAYFPVLSSFADMLDQIEDMLVEADSSFAVMHQLHAIRQDVRSLRHNAWSQRDVINALIGYHGDLVHDETRLHLRDVADHTLRVVEMLESSRDSCSDLQDLYMSMLSLRMNEVMKVLTIIATIFIPLSFIAGLYGMNFDARVSSWNMPETKWRYGYPMALGIMLIVAMGMLIFFRRRGWIGQKP